MYLQKTRILLVNPATPFSYWGFQGSAKFIAQAAHIPLGLITLAAILPQAWEFRLRDMNFQTLREKDIAWADAVMITGMIIQKASIQDVLARIAGRKPTIVGGPFASSTPEAPELASATTRFIGEAEDRVAMSELISDIERRKLLPSYRAKLERADLGTSPTPRFDLLNRRAYAAFSIQASRGCQHDCDFCSVTFLFGLRPRYKSPAQITAELEAIRCLGYRGDVFFVDDNFINSPTRSRKIVAAMKLWQDRHKHPFLFYTQASLNIAQDTNIELAMAMVDVGFKAVFIGIETPSAESLASVGKKQNIGVDITAAAKRLLAIGIIPYAGYIAGFDTDGPDIFERIYNSVEEASISMAMVGVLIAIPGTKLFRQMIAAGRITGDTEGDSYDTNIAPVMGRKELLAGYRALVQKLYDPEIFFARAARELDEWKQTRVRATGFREYRAALRSVWHQGVWKAPYKLQYWKFLRRFHGTGKLPRAIAIAIYYHHLYIYTREVILPRLKAELDTV